MTTITTTSDIAAYVADTCGNHPAEEQSQIVEELRSADHPAWGSDWSEWLETALGEACDTVISRASAQA